MELFVLFLCVVLTEATTNIINKGDIFDPLRKFMFNHREDNLVCKFLHSVISCPYCLSVWVGVFYAIMYLLYCSNLLPTIFIVFFGGLLLHRFSNVLHFIIDRINRLYDITG